MQKLIELAEKIQDKELRKKVIDYIKNPILSHKGFKKYPQEKLEKVKTFFAVGGTATERDVLNHTVAITETCLNIAETLEKNLKIKVNKDFLTAGALVHDVMKIYEWKMTQAGPEHTGIMLDHSFLGVAELYTREFPEEVIHIVASHFGEGGPTPPITVEAFILHNVDNMFSLIEHNANAKTQQDQIPILFLDKETLKKLDESAEKK